MTASTSFVPNHSSGTFGINAIEELGIDGKVKEKNNTGNSMTCMWIMNATRKNLKTSNKHFNRNFSLLE